ncbi:MAG: isoprenylcysteine carboxylmethyltransferase family protein [Gemmatimonadaceae bacterium]
MNEVLASSKDSPGVLVFPPLLFGGTLVLGLVLHALVPLGLRLPVLPARAAGVVLVIGGALLARWAETTMHEAGTNVNPGKPTTAIVIAGPFRYTRNPLYLAVTAVYGGISLLVPAVWPLLLLVLVLIVLQWGVIMREERYLERKFGEPYREYRKQVRRWL